MKIDSSQDLKTLEWANSRIPGAQFSPDRCAWIAKRDGEQIKCVVIYEGETDHNISMHIAADGPDWASRGFLKAAFDYPFKFLGKRRVTFAAPSDNEKALRLHKKLGAKREGVLRGFHGEQDLVVSGLLADECKW